MVSTFHMVTAGGFSQTMSYSEAGGGAGGRGQWERKGFAKK